MGSNSNKTIPLEIQVLNRQAMEMSGHGHYRDALKIFSRIVYIAPHFARAQYEMGRCLESLGRFKEAVERYDKAMQLDPMCRSVKLKTSSADTRRFGHRLLKRRKHVLCLRLILIPR